MDAKYFVENIEEKEVQTYERIFEIIVTLFLPRILANILMHSLVELSLIEITWTIPPYHENCIKDLSLLLVLILISFYFVGWTITQSVYLWIGSTSYLLKFRFRDTLMNDDHVTNRHCWQNRMPDNVTIFTFELKPLI